MNEFKVNDRVELNCLYGEVPIGACGTITHVKYNTHSDHLYTMKLDEPIGTKDDLKCFGSRFNLVEQTSFKLGDTVKLVAGVYKDSFGEVIEVLDNNAGLLLRVSGVSWKVQTPLEGVVIYSPTPTVSTKLAPALKEAGFVEPETFTKFDEGKAELKYLLDTPLASAEKCKVRAFGAKKYTRHNWYKCKDPERYLSACLRHLHSTGEDLLAKDTESGLDHVAHALCSLEFYYELLLRQKAMYDVE